MDRRAFKAMQDAQAFLSQPGVGFFSMLIIGAIAGWIAGRVMETEKIESVDVH
jgi:hypothetical protein